MAAGLGMAVIGAAVGEVVGVVAGEAIGVAVIVAAMVAVVMVAVAVMAAAVTAAAVTAAITDGGTERSSFRFRVANSPTSARNAIVSLRFSRTICTGGTHSSSPKTSLSESTIHLHGDGQAARHRTH